MAYGRNILEIDIGGYLTAVRQAGYSWILGMEI
jgi:hypothetical protein